MRTLVIAIIVSLAAVTARAASPATEVIAEADLLRVQLAQSQAELRARDAADAKRSAEDAVKELRAKYKLGDRDSIDATTRAIRRAPPPDKPEPKKK